MFQREAWWLNSCTEWHFVEFLSFSNFCWEHQFHHIQKWKDTESKFLWAWAIKHIIFLNLFNVDLGIATCNQLNTQWLQIRERAYFVNSRKITKVFFLFSSCTNIYKCQLANKCMIKFKFSYKSVVLKQKSN